MDKAVTLTVSAEGIAVVALEDRASGNTFTPALIGGLMEAFEAIAAHPDARVVVMHGYDSYFCCGGTKEELLGIQDGTVSFADLPFYDLPLRCDLPVVAAMQGHALGGGLVLGCYADILVMAEECMYGAVFMKYGFTPGMGGTYIVPEKFGRLLGTEMLFTGKNYFGHELKARGAPPRIVGKSAVVDTALAVARELADKPRLALVELKKHLVADTRRAIPRVIREELAMHAVTFAQPEVRARIEDRFDR